MRVRWDSNPSESFTFARGQDAWAILRLRPLDQVGETVNTPAIPFQVVPSFDICMPKGGRCNYGWPMSQQSESLLTQKQSLRLSDLPSCYESLGESTAANDLPEPDFVKEELEAESAARHLCNLRLKTLWTHFPDNRAEPDRPRKVRPDQLSKKYRQQILRVSAITSRNTVP